MRQRRLREIEWIRGIQKALDVLIWQWVLEDIEAGWWGGGAEREREIERECV